MNTRQAIRHCLPSHVQIGSEAVHESRLDEDLGPPTQAPFSPGAVLPDQEHRFHSLAESIRSTAQALNDYEAGALQDREAIELFEHLVRTGLIEFMNESLRSTASALARSGHIAQMAEAENFKRNVQGQQAQQGTPNIQVKGSAPQYRQNANTAPVSTVSDIGSQKAQGGPAQVPQPPQGSVTSQGHDKFPSSGGRSADPARVPKPVGKQKAGPNHGDKMAGGKGMKVGNSLQQMEDPDKDEGEYDGSKVGSVR